MVPIENKLFGIMPMVKIYVDAKLLLSSIYNKISMFFCLLTYASVKVHTKSLRGCNPNILIFGLFDNRQLTSFYHRNF